MDKKKPKEQVLKLYVWEGVLTDYTSGIAVALAYSAKEAKQKLIEAGMAAYLWKGITIDGVKPTIHKKPVGYYVYGGG